jgi:glycosyltransferase involved in cell wall biosynthesis
MRILHLSTYPVTGELAGGSARLAAIVEEIGRTGAVSHVLAAVPPGHAARADAFETVLPLPQDAFGAAEWQAVGYHDTLTGRAAAASPSYLDAAVAVAERFRPNVLWLEQPFLLAVVDAIRRRLGRIPFVYSAANIEAPLKGALIDLVPQHYRYPEPLIPHVDTLERAAARAADLVVAISPADAEVMRGWGAANVVIAGNGSRMAAAAPSERSGTTGRPQADVKLFGCFGSAYWPNAEGLASVVRPSLAFLPPDARLVVAGRLGEAVRQSPAFAHGRTVNEARMTDLGYLSQPDYLEFLGTVDAFVLPVFVGGGSSLKAADALATGKPVLMTRCTAVGYEDIIALDPGALVIADDPAGFRSAWRDLATRSRQALAELGRLRSDRRELLRWSARLQPLREALRPLALARA